MTKEIRATATPVEYRNGEEQGEEYIEGIALRFNSWSEDLGGFVETISPESLESTDMSDVRALFNHNADQVLSRTSAGTLELSIDDEGLKFRSKIPNTTYGQDLKENLRNGNVNQCSFGFVLDEDGDEFTYDKEEGIYKRTLRSIKEIVDVSIVSYPAYRDTEASYALRSIDQIEKQKELEQRQKEKEKLRLQLELM